MLIFSDNRAARFILTADRQPSERRAKLVAKFSGASIQHIEGKRNVVVDFLSRPEYNSGGSNSNRLSSREWNCEKGQDFKK